MAQVFPYIHLQRPDGESEAVVLTHTQPGLHLQPPAPGFSLQVFGPAYTQLGWLQKPLLHHGLNLAGASTPLDEEEPALSLLVDFSTSSPRALENSFWHRS